jgi:hypothetical protein
LLIFSKLETDIDNLYKKLAQELEITNLGDANYYLSIEIIKRDNITYLSQKRFLERLLSKYNKTNLKLRNTPYILGEKLIKNSLQASSSDINKY